MLILFDIDATLVSTSSAGIAAIAAAGRQLHSPSFDATTVQYAGRLDPLIIADVLTANNVDPTPAAIEQLALAYATNLSRLLNTPDYPAAALPGVAALLDRLAEHPHLKLGLLTGNYERSGRIKLSACNIDPDRFHIHTWGDHSPHTPPSRDHLPAVAIARYAQLFNIPLDPAHVTIVGDTPHDIRCALANNCRALGVATGHSSTADLLAAGAHHAVDNLSATDDILLWLLSLQPNHTR